MTFPSSAPLVGMRFRPPALTIVQGLGVDQFLVLKREPYNTYDENAIAVYMPESWSNDMPDLFNEACQEADSLGKEFEEGNAMLGYIAREVAALWSPVFDQILQEDANNSLPPARLTFSVSGSPTVSIESVDTPDNEGESDFGDD